MKDHRRHPALLALLLGLIAVGWGCSSSSNSVLRPASGAACEAAAAEALAACIGDLSDAERACYLESGGACGAGNADVGAALAGIADGIDESCPTDEIVREAGYGPLFTTATLADRLSASCQAESAALIARSFGGPQGAALAGADGTGRACLEQAHESGALLLARGLELRSTCIDDESGGESCDPAAVQSEVDAAEAEAGATIAGACPALQDLVGVTATDFLARTELQAQCLTAIAHPDAAPLDVACGPRDDVPALPRGQWTQVVLDESEFGTRCGDGSPYAFQVWLPPEGTPVENVVVGMEGGGVCVFEEDCASRPADLFEALSDPPFELGPLSNDPSFNPFASWTKVFLPYCTQDVFIGGGATSNWPSITVHRFGSIDTRASLQYLRDLIWRELDGDTAEGYRPDRMRVLFGGFSAGAFGTLYNYHYVLDDLQWAHTAAYPDAALALDNGEALGVRGLGAIVASDAAPIGWGARSYLPPYCFATDCGVGPVILAATAPRLRAVPEQQFLILSNQVDQTQVSTTFFDTTESWINALRVAYCETRGLNGVFYYMPAIPESVHVISPRPDLYAENLVAGETIRDFLEGGFTDPANVADRVEEGTLVEAYPGVAPFACPVAP